MLFPTSKLILMRLYSFSPNNSLCLRITFIINLGIEILVIPVLLQIKNLIKIKSLHYIDILRVFITLKCLFSIRLLHKLPIRSLQSLMIVIILLQSANVGLLAGLKPIRNIPWLKRNQLNLNNNKSWMLKISADSLSDSNMQKLNIRLRMLICGIWINLAFK